MIVPTRFNGKPETKEDVMALPRERAISGVYFLFCEGDCIYVGQSKNVRRRVMDHHLTTRYRKEFDSYSFIEVPEIDLPAWEQYYIGLMMPKMNVQGVGRYVPPAPEKKHWTQVRAEYLAKEAAQEAATSILTTNG